MTSLPYGVCGVSRFEQQGRVSTLRGETSFAPAGAEE
jgi:hypothetical protein